MRRDRCFSYASLSVSRFLFGQLLRIAKHGQPSRPSFSQSQLASATHSFARFVHEEFADVGHSSEPLCFYQGGVTSQSTLVSSRQRPSKVRFVKISPSWPASEKLEPVDEYHCRADPRMAPLSMSCYNTRTVCAKDCLRFLTSFGKWQYHVYSAGGAHHPASMTSHEAYMLATCPRTTRN